MVNRINGFSQVPSAGTKSTNPAGNFGDAFRKELTRAQEDSPQKSVQAPFVPGVEFSKHAILRAAERGIEVTPELVSQLSDSVEKASAKGATNILALDSAGAFIINVPNCKVITTMSPEEMKENIFTNIDGAVIL